MVILHLTDSHVSASTADHPSPRKWRSSSYEDDVFAKLEWVRDYAGQFDDAAIIHSGDGFDRPTEPLKTSLRYADWVRSFGNIPFIHAVGQHDVRGYAIETLNECSLGIVQRLGNALEDWHKVTDETGFEWNIRSLDCTKEALLNEEDPFEVQAADIVVPHLSIHPNAYGCVHPEAIAWSKPVLVLCSHIHSGFPLMKTRRGCTFSAPGALVRLNADEVERQPQIAVIEVSGGTVVEATYVPLPCKPAVEVFDMGAMQQKQDEVKERTEFREAINEVSAEFTGDWRAMLESAREWAGDDTVDKLIPYCERV